MKMNLAYFYLLGITVALGACKFSESTPPSVSAITHPEKQEIILEGSPLYIDGGIMVLIQNGPLKTVPAVMIAGNDSVKRIMRAKYDDRMSNVYQPAARSWVKISGIFLREDTIRPIFKYTWIEFLDQSEEMKDVQELEE